ncbi:Cytochrome oxidase c subunit VIb, partial [Musa troglodytarum]
VLAQGRAACYKVWGALYACLEKEADKKPTEIATVGLLYPAQCKASRAEFAAKCRPTWVKHFDRQYCAKKRVQRLLDNGSDPRRGPISFRQPYTFKP